MKNTEKRIPNFSVGSTFLVGAGAKYPVQMRVLSQKGTRVKVEISTPRRPRVCRKCGSLALSRNGVTGVTVCMATGCGYNFGYRQVKTTTIEAVDLTRV